MGERKRGEGHDSLLFFLAHKKNSTYYIILITKILFPSSKKKKKKLQFIFVKKGAGLIVIFTFERKIIYYVHDKDFFK